MCGHEGFDGLGKEFVLGRAMDCEPVKRCKKRHHVVAVARERNDFGSRVPDRN